MAHILYLTLCGLPNAKGFKRLRSPRERDRSAIKLIFSCEDLWVYFVRTHVCSRCWVAQKSPKNSQAQSPCSLASCDPSNSTQLYSVASVFILFGLCSNGDLSETLLKRPLELPRRELGSQAPSDDPAG